MTTFPTCRTADDDVIGSSGSGGKRHEALSTAGGGGGGRGRGGASGEGAGDSLTPYRKLSDTLN